MTLVLLDGKGSVQVGGGEVGGGGEVDLRLWGARSLGWDDCVFWDRKGMLKVW